MKKLLIAIQVIALVAMFPALLVVALNHSTKRLPANNPPSEIIEKLGESNIQQALNTGYEGLFSSVIKMNAYSLNR